MPRVVPYPPLIPDDVWRQILAAKKKYQRQKSSIKESWLNGHIDLQTKMARDKANQDRLGQVFVSLGFPADQQFQAQRIRQGCGTTAGYERHRRQGQKACRQCLDAYAAQRRLDNKAGVFERLRLAEAKAEAEARQNARHLKANRIVVFAD